MSERFVVRQAVPEDAAGAAGLLRGAFAPHGGLLPGLAEMTAEDLAVAMQTGSEFLVAERGEEIVGVVRRWSEEGIGWFDALASGRFGAGHALVRAVEHWAQDRGFRVVRARIPEAGAVPERFARWGYLGVRREEGLLEVERRLPLLTVREQRREDAEVIGELAGIDPWPFTQGRLGGWFVVADGDRIVGVVSVDDLERGAGRVAEPVLLDEYRGRGIEVWMIERAAEDASRRGYHSIEVAASPAIDAVRRDLEDRHWVYDGPGRDACYRKRFGSPPEDEGLGDW